MSALPFCSLALSNRRARDDSPEGRHPSRPSGQASGPCFPAIRPAAEPPPHCSCSNLPPLGGDKGDSGIVHPESPLFSSHLLEFHLGAGLFEDGLDLLGLVLAHA